MVGAQKLVMNTGAKIALGIGGVLLYLKITGVKIFGERIDVTYGDNVPATALNAHMEYAYRIAQQVYAPYQVVITSHTGGTHNPGSLHPSGFAIDLRTKNLPGGSSGSTAREIAGTLRHRLGTAYDVVLESDHIHVEYDPA